MQTVYARGGAGDGGGSQQRQVADGADGVDVVFTDTATVQCAPYGRTSLLLFRQVDLFVLFIILCLSACKCKPRFRL